MNEGLTADLYHYSPEPRPPVQKEPINKVFVTFVAVMSALAAVGAYSITSFQPAPPPVDGVQYLDITKFTGLDLTGGRRSVLTPNFNVDIGQANCQMYNLTGTPKYYLRATIFAFEYTNLTPPATFVEARLVLPISDIISNAVNSTSVWGKDRGFNPNRAFTLSLYEIRGNWPLSADYPYYNKIGWYDLNINTPPMDRNPVSVVNNITYSKYWVKDNHYGLANLIYPEFAPLYFDITRAINDWKAGLWNPAYGFLVAMIAPWETTNQPWFDITGFKYLGLGLAYELNGTQIQIGIFDVIPEFPTALIPIIAVCALIVLLRRKPYIIPKT